MLNEAQGVNNFAITPEVKALSFRSKFPTHLCIPNEDIVALYDFTDREGFGFAYLGPISDANLERFYQENARKEKYAQALKSLVSAGSQDNDYAVSRYDIDYGTLQYDPFKTVLSRLSPETWDLEESNLEAAFFAATNYSFYSALIDPVVSPRIVDPSLFQKAKIILDVGCGNGQLLDFLHKDLGVPKDRLQGIDISNASISLLKQSGYSVTLGSLPQVAEKQGQDFLADKSIGIMFLSYFIDRDADQRATFNSVIRKLEPGGAIILEGLFPVRPVDSLGGVYSTEERLITRGQSVSDDVERLVQYFNDNSNGAIKLQKIVVGERLVYSLDGFEILPSVFLCFRRECE